MITEKDLQEAIAECEGQRNPNANTCIKLAAFYTIKREMFGSSPEEALPVYGYSRGVSEYDSGTEFSDAVMGKDLQEIFPVIDELLESLRLVMPRLYESFITKIRDA